MSEADPVMGEPELLVREHPASTPEAPLWYAQVAYWPRTSLERVVYVTRPSPSRSVVGREAEVYCRTLARTEVRQTGPGEWEAS